MLIGRIMAAYNTISFNMQNQRELIIDSGSCDNVIAEEAILKQGIKKEPHPSPY